MKTYEVTFREWMYQEKTMTVKASSKEEARLLASEQMDCPDDDNAMEEWCGSKFKCLKPRTRVRKTS